MKIVRFQAENVKKLRAVEIVPDGNVVQITGPNGSGKSSVLDAIFYALAGTKEIPSQPVRKGMKKARVKLELGEITVIRSFTEGGGTTLIVEGAKGARFPSPQKMLDDMLGTMTFDPLAFSRMDAKKQLEQLRGLVKLDIDIDELDRANDADFATRTDVKRTLKALQAQADAVQFDPNAPSEPVDTEQLLARMQEAGEANTLLEQRRLRRESTAAGLDALRGAVSRFEVRIADLERDLALQRQMMQADLDKATEAEKRLAEAEALPPPIDVGAIRSQIDQATAINAAVARRARRLELQREVDAAQARADDLTTAMEARTKQRTDAIANAAMPVPGLSFGDAEVLYNGLPFDQASSAEQLRVSVAIAMSANPELRIMRIKDGSLLDENGLRLIGEMAAAEDWQVWMECVDTSGRVGIVMDDGNVAAVNLEAA